MITLMARRKATPDAEGQGYQAIATQLREAIAMGETLPGTLLPTERELQARFNVSRTTIRRALTALVESGWAEALPNRGVASRLGPRSPATTNIAFVDDGDVMNRDVYFALGRILQAAGHNLVLVDSQIYRMEGAMEHAHRQGFAAAVVWSKIGFPEVDRIKAVMHDIPIIALDHGLRGVALDVITEDNLGGAEQMMHHLFRHGRRRVAVSGMMDMLDCTHDRFSGYLKGTFTAGRIPDVRDFVFCLTSGMQGPNTSALEHRLREADRPDAVFVLQDLCVPMVCQAITAVGLRVPDDVAVVSWGGGFSIVIDDFGVTQVVSDPEAMAQRTADRILYRLQHPVAPPSTQVMPVELVVRGSCGAPREQWHHAQPEPVGASDIYAFARQRLSYHVRQTESEGASEGSISHHQGAMQ